MVGEQKGSGLQASGGDSGHSPPSGFAVVVDDTVVLLAAAARSPCSC